MSLALTGEMLKLVVPTMTIEKATQLADNFNFILPAYKITEPTQFHEMFARGAAESGGFRIKEENLNYTTNRLVQIWPNRFAHGKVKEKLNANDYHHQPQKIAEVVYGGRMGNTAPGDGWNFRGGGYAQLTGKDMYLAYQKWARFDSLDILAEAVRKDEYWAVDSLCWLFAVKKDLIKLAEKNELVTIVKKWNGGTIGLTETKEYYNRAVKYIK